MTSVGLLGPTASRAASRGSCGGRVSRAACGLWGEVAHERGRHSQGIVTERRRSSEQRYNQLQERLVLLTGLFELGKGDEVVHELEHRTPRGEDSWARRCGDYGKCCRRGGRQTNVGQTRGSQPTQGSGSRRDVSSHCGTSSSSCNSGRGGGGKTVIVHRRRSGNPRQTR